MRLFSSHLIEWQLIKVKIEFDFFKIQSTTIK